MTRIQGLNANGEELRSAYVEHDPVFAPHEDDGRTRQEFRDETDINIILERYDRTGVIPNVNGLEPLYMDVGEMPTDLLRSLQYMEMAQEAFMRLPAKVRREFDNDPVVFADYAANPANLSQMREWGLAAPVEPADAVSSSEAGGEPAASAAPKAP